MWWWWGGTTEAVWGFVGATPPPSPLWWWGRPITALPALGGGLQALRRPHGGRPGAAEAPRREAGGRQGAMAAPQSAAGPRGRRRKPGAAWRWMALRVGFEVILGWVGDKERAGGLGGCGATQREGWPWSCRLPAPLLQDPSLQRSPLLPTSPLLFALFHSNPCICFSFFIFFFLSLLPPSVETHRTGAAGGDSAAGCTRTAPWCHGPAEPLAPRGRAAWKRPARGRSSPELLWGCPHL